ncbi:MAG: hypothetical protein RL701_2726, partial [Pseudomonadota bacterium]
QRGQWAFGDFECDFHHRTELSALAPIVPTHLHGLLENRSTTTEQRLGRLETLE